jgi:hypothetical protein
MFIFNRFPPLPVDQKCPGDVDFHSSDWDIKTITSAMKFYLRCVPILLNHPAGDTQEPAALEQQVQ